MDWDSFGWTGVDCDYEDKPLLVTYREVPDDFPRKQLSLRLNIFWRLYESDENGLPTDDEFERLKRFEDRVIEAFETDQHSILVMVLTANGEREYVFQTADPDGFKQRLTSMEQELERYPIEIYLNDDPDWDYYESVCDSVE